MQDAVDSLQRFEQRLGRRLASWGVLSMVAGIAMQAVRDKSWRAFGWQCLGWGAVDGAIAAVGLASASRPREAPAERRATGLRRLLLLNAGLDVLYITGGLMLIRSGRSRPSAVRTGSGAGIAAQGIVLLFFDLAHALFVPQLTK